jgi:hypothetical protein
MSENTDGMIERNGLLGVGGESTEVVMRFSDRSRFGHGKKRAMSRDALDAFFNAPSVTTIKLKSGRRQGHQLLADGTTTLVLTEI